MLKESRQRRVYADHNQFYIVDSFPFRYARKPAFPGDPGGGALWNPQEFQDRMAAIPGMVAVSTGSYGFVQVIIELHTSQPEAQLQKWDHVSEGPLEMMTGDLRIINGMDDAAEQFTVEPGHYRVRCCHANLAGAVDSGEGRDWYLVQIWAAPYSPVHVLKRAARPGSGAAPVPAKPQVWIRPSEGAKSGVTRDGRGLQAQAITLRRLISIAYGSLNEPEFPLDLILGPPRIDQGLYDASAQGEGWPHELRRVLSAQFRWKFDFVMRGSQPSGRYCLGISNLDDDRLREENLRRHAR